MNQFINGNGRTRRGLARGWFLLAISSALVVAGCAGAKPTSQAETKDVAQVESADIDASEAEATENNARKMDMRPTREDVKRLVQLNYEQLVSSEVFHAWEEQSRGGVEGRALVAVKPIRNETDLLIAPSLDSLISQLETRLVNEQVVAVVALENQPEVSAELARQAVGVPEDTQYIVSGVATEKAEPTSQAERSQYSVEIHVIDVKTGELVFRNVSPLKAPAAARDQLPTGRGYKSLPQ